MSSGVCAIAGEEGCDGDGPPTDDPKNEGTAADEGGAGAEAAEPNNANPPPGGGCDGDDAPVNNPNPEETAGGEGAAGGGGAEANNANPRGEESKESEGDEA